MKITIDIDDKDVINILDKFIPLLNSKQSNEYKLINPNKRYDPNHTIIDIFDSEEKIDRFFDKYSYNNNYAYNNFDNLKIGQRILIKDGNYDKLWFIAGFDAEHNKVASDGTIYDNGHGIMLIPESGLFDCNWDFFWSKFKWLYWFYYAYNYII